MFFWNSLSFSMFQQMLAIWFSGSPAFSKFSLNIWKFSVHILLKPGLENFEHYFAGMWDKCNCAVVWTFFGIAFLWDWTENWLFPVLWPLLSFPNLLAYWVQHFHSQISPPTLPIVVFPWTVFLLTSIMNNFFFNMGFLKWHVYLHSSWGSIPWAPAVHNFIPFTVPW